MLIFVQHIAAKHSRGSANAGAITRRSKKRKSTRHNPKKLALKVRVVSFVVKFPTVPLNDDAKEFLGLSSTIRDDEFKLPRASKESDEPQVTQVDNDGSQGNMFGKVSFPNR